LDVFPEIPGYTILEELGEGGMGKIFLAQDLIFNRKVALKVLLPNHPSYKSIVERFKYEGEALKKLNHTNIINIFDIGKTGNIYYLSMEYLEGGNLKNKITSKKGKELEENEIINILKKVASALEYAHKTGIIHRDIKPENILFRDDKTPVLADFGIVKDFTAEKSLTVTGTSMGTPYYMSPEQIKGYKPDERNDIYSLGVVLYEMLTGKVPYDASDLISIALKHERAPIPTLPKKYSKFQKLINKMMSKDRETRLRSGTEVIKLAEICRKETGREKRKWVRKVLKYKSVKILIFFIVVFFIPVLSGYFFLNDFKIPESFRETLVHRKNISVDSNKYREKKAKTNKRNKKKIRFVKREYRLRSYSRKIDMKGLKRIIKNYDFYDSNINVNGNFKNKYKTEIVGKDKVIIDKVTFLMWDQKGSFSSMKFSKAKEWIRKLNRSRYAGFSNWRLPTLDEAYSILEKKKWYGDLHIYSVFSAIQNSIWTKDYNEDGTSHWIMDFKKGRAKTPSLFKKKSFVRVVRTIKYLRK